MKMRDILSKFQILIFIVINLSVLLSISWGYIFFRIKKTAANEMLIAEKIQQLKGIVTKHKKDNSNAPMGAAEFKLQQECIANLQAINQQQLEAMVEIEEVENNDNLDQETKERYIKAQLASLKAQSNAYDDTVSILRKQINQGNNRLSFIEEKLLKQKQELINLRVMEDKFEMDKLKNIELKDENIDLKNRVENQEADKQSLNEMSDTINKQRQKIENQDSELEQLMQEYLRLEEESKIEIDSDIESIASDISEIEFALERALTEKDFLESQFLDLLDHNDNQVKLKDELKRTKTEYMMLEEHFIDLAEKK
jgi:chromosome segregation ATPase